MMAHLCVSVYDHLQNRRSISRRKLAFYLCLQEFPGQTNHPECTSGNEGRREMGKQFSVETAVCTEHQRLLEGCQRALEIWNERRAEVCQSRLSGKEAGNELLRLQAKYAQAYTVLQRHAHNSSVCQLVSRVEGGDPENSSEAPSDSKLYV